MRLSHPDYIKLVIGTYKKKRADNSLSSVLTRSTPARIKRECLTVFNERHNKKDDGMLRDFFGPEQPGKSLAQVIKKFETSKFKPLDNYLKEQTEKTDDKNIALLAWLIDFKHRPYSTGMDVLLSDEELSLLSKPTPVPEPEENSLQGIAEPPVTTIEEPEDFLENEPGKEEERKKPGAQVSSLAVPLDFKQKKRNKKTVIALLILVIFAGGVYVIWQQKQNKQVVMGNTNASCMYWADDHYEKTPCNEERKDRLLLPLNEEKMRHFKRITREDTITDKSIGKIYYIKNGRTIEYYTAGGNHPIEVTRSLKPLSLYMFDKYLRKQEMTSKGVASAENPDFINNR